MSNISGVYLQMQEEIGHTAGTECTVKSGVKLWITRTSRVMTEGVGKRRG